MIPLLVGAGVLVLLVLFFIGLYNGLVRLRQQVKNAWSQIDVQLKRRHDLIPNLVETVRGYAGHEKQTLENVIRARNMAVQANGATAQIKAETELGGALGRLMVVLENYPDLKANTNFLQLQEEISSTENKIGFSRQHYNDSVMHYNTQIQTVPSNFVAGMGGFTAEPFFEISNEAEREVPKVKF